MSQLGLPAGLRKFIRLEKARIRREILDVQKQTEAINELYLSVLRKEKAPKA